MRWSWAEVEAEPIAAPGSKPEAGINKQGNRVFQTVLPAISRMSVRIRSRACNKQMNRGEVWLRRQPAQENRTYEQHEIQLDRNRQRRPNQSLDKRREVGGRSEEAALERRSTAVRLQMGRRYA